MNILLEGTTECKGYVAAIDSLTINEENRLQKQVQELKEEDEYKNYLIEQKLKNLENENIELKQELEKTIQAYDFSEIREQLNEIRKQMKEGPNYEYS